MKTEEHVELKGFDSFEIRLGDELRGERASKGKTLMDVQRDLRIRADYIAAIENADASAFPVPGFAAGYVKSYARYLGLDSDDIYRRFCEESGFSGVEGGAMTPTLGKGAPVDPSASRASEAAVRSLSFSTGYLPPSAQRATSIDIAGGLRSVASLCILAALVGGLGYGGWSVLQNLQRVGFAPLPTPPTVQVSAPDILSPGEVETARPAPEVLEAEEARITLAAIYASQEDGGPLVTPRDGPISSIDPDRAGVLAPPAPAPAPVMEATPELAMLGVDPALAAAAEALEAERAAEAALLPTAPGVAIFATAEAWVRVRDGDSRTLFTGILGAGEHFALPAGAETPKLRAGNAGAVYIVIDGAAFGPLGDGPEVAKNVELTAEAVRAAYPAATGVALKLPQAEEREASLDTGVARLD